MWLRDDTMLRTINHGKELNIDVIHRIKTIDAPVRLYLEKLMCQGALVGMTTFLTAEMCGRIKQIWEDNVAANPTGDPLNEVHRSSVKSFWCGKSVANDGMIRRAIIERFGGKDKAIGRKATPGPLYGIHADEWQALAIALMHVDDLEAWTK